MSLLLESDLEYLHSKGITKDKIRDQLETFREGIPYVNLEKAAIIGDGISKFSPTEEKSLITEFDKAKTGLTLLKFVPASGAASRMFKALFNFLDAYHPSEEKLKDYFERTGDKDLKLFHEQMESFPFLLPVIERIGSSFDSEGEELHQFVKEMLSEKGLNYGFYPKGLLPFHKHVRHTATPFEEHLIEGSVYAKTGSVAKLHFTISEQHTELFNKEYETINTRVSQMTKTSFDISYSYQKSSTDTIAVNLDNTLFRNSDGSLLFRPGGHGALIENLNEQNADIIFIKNIDNVVVPENAQVVTNSKKVLAGFLIRLQQKAFIYAKLLDEHKVKDEQLITIKEFLEEELNVRFTDSYDSFSPEEQVKILQDKINRPIRVCGMVKNEGEPGGGPFWVKDAKNRVSLQIVESAQMDASNEDQNEIVAQATHFNPVDLVCGVRNYKGEKYDLMNFIDPRQGFITGKTKDGKELKALELPGLWNGAMAYWNTIFVEVPLLTFNPVKTVNDLLKPSHQVR
ncbi:DUF4301 family protein [Maribacter algarum]|uniref:DUF4301 family protein n=1 Tax=Maribacter algarum (ex Zhang et al. 2020) TaxID=2578118 RepID=A0A5S3QN56_9FLAO|nr:DUF4301 family protein [Maribacter algarum]TMM59334.1 DUF4301 family protein [Maribacter algarum]